MNRAIPSNYKLLYSANAIRKRVEDLGKAVGTWASTVTEESGEQVLACCVLRGGAYFFADLVRALPCSVEPAFCRSWSYAVSDNSLSRDGVRISVESVAAAGRVILLVDDICETGGSLSKLHKVFLELGARDVKSVVCVHRLLEGAQYKPTWSGFEFPGKEWFVGYGMDDRNYHSTLPDIYTVSP